ncbi:uncharacterized protein EKO05_0001162 [Ascochyta rabiei]|uniref:uncharacterized protein n=1 Tax=Didymella rabiei TaxID=5454 RepID=UPI002204A927|nr:uncharacterized protein EKO05_0001162 [Ascochyta rabiei]UPX10506.1 hypothetical protein EKO05_0001162 [Ascochyta rabiei]
MDISKSMYGLLGHKKESLHYSLKLAKMLQPLSVEKSCAPTTESQKLCLSNSNRLTLGYAKSSVYTQKPTGNWPEHFPVSIEFTDGRTTLRPLAIHLVTSRPVLFEEAELAPHSANKNKPLPGKCALQWDCYT